MLILQEIILRDCRYSKILKMLTIEIIILLISLGSFGV